jgi:hypothetical protein
LDKNLSVTNFTGAGGFDNGVNGRLHETVTDSDSELHLLVKFNHKLTAAVLLNDASLTAMTTDTGDSDASYPGLKESLFNLG